MPSYPHFICWSIFDRFLLPTWTSRTPKIIDILFVFIRVFWLRCFQNKNHRGLHLGATIHHFTSQNHKKNQPKHEKKTKFWKIASRLHETLKIKGPGSQKHPQSHKKRSQGHAKTQPNFSLIVASIFHRFLIDFGTPCDPLLRPKTLKMGGRYSILAALGPTWELFLHRTPPKSPNGPKMDPKWN